MSRKIAEQDRKRAPSERSLAAQASILDAAEMLFAHSGFDGTGLRDIGRAAGVSTALVAHHGGSKEELFEQVIARRAEELATARIKALEQCCETQPLTVPGVLECFVMPLLNKAFHEGDHWLAYSRLIAHVSADERWRPITNRWFDPTAAVFLHELSVLLPEIPPEILRARFVFMVSAMLSLVTSRWRIATDAPPPHPETLVKDLMQFCVAGFGADQAEAS